MKVTQPPASPGRGKRGKGAPPQRKKRTAAPATTPADRDPSEDARILETATEVVRQLPGASPERLQELKRQIREGTYEPEAADVADRLVDEHVKAKLDE